MTARGRGESDPILAFLQDRLESVTAWLQYAEAKNAAAGALAVALATIAAAAAAAGEPPSSPWVALAILIYSTQLFGLSCIALAITLTSFLPLRDRPPAPRKPGKRQNHGSLLYFEDVARTEPGELVARLCARFGVADSSDAIQYDYSTQIVAIARIAARKLDIFEIVAWLLITAVITPAGAALLLAFRRWGSRGTAD